MKLEKKKFVEDPELNARKLKLSQQYDKVFDKIVKCKKGSKEHLILLKQAEKINNITRKILEGNHWYFTRKRKHTLLNGEMSTLSNTISINPPTFRGRNVSSQPSFTRMRGY